MHVLISVKRKNKNCWILAIIYEETAGRNAYQCRSATHYVVSF